MSTVPFDKFLGDRLKNPEFAAQYLNSVLDDGTPDEIADAVKAILEARVEQPFPAITKPVVEQLQYLLHKAGLKLHVQPAA